MGRRGTISLSQETLSRITVGTILTRIRRCPVKRLAASLSIFFILLGLGVRGEEVFRLDEIVVTATKTPEEQREIPNATVIKKSQDLELSTARTIGELLSSEPGIGWLTYGDYGGASQSLYIRGVRADGTQVFVNGVNVNSPSLGEADLSKIPLDNIERIEVVKGSGSLLYGSGAMGGIVSIFTKEPKKEKTDLDLRVAYGTNHTFSASFKHGMFLREPFGYYLTVGRIETEGARENGHSKRNDASLKLVAEKGQAMRFTLYADLVDTSYGVPGVRPPEGTEEYSRDGVRFYNHESASLVNHGEDKDANLAVEAKGNPNERFSYNLKAFRRYMNNYYYQRYPSSGTGTEAWVVNTVDGTEGSVSVSPSTKIKVLLGAEYKEFGWRRESFYLDAYGERGSKSRTKAQIYTKAVFVEGELLPSDSFKLISGLRREDHSAFGGENIPLFGCVLNPKEGMAIKLTHGRHFKAPTPNDLYWPEGVYEKGNPNLKPEIGWHSDLTYEHVLLDGKALLSLSLFRWRIDRKIQWEPDAYGVWTPTNLEDYGADGLETGIKVNPLKGLSMALSYTYTDAYEKAREYTIQDYGWPPFFPPRFEYSIKKRRAILVPRNELKLEVTYETDMGLKAAIAARYVDERIGIYRTEYTNYPNTRTATYRLDPYWTVDLKLEKAFKNFRLSLDARNLLDESYATRLGTFYDKSGRGTVCPYPAPGRSFLLRLCYGF